MLTCLLSPLKIYQIVLRVPVTHLLTSFFHPSHFRIYSSPLPLSPSPPISLLPPPLFLLLISSFRPLPLLPNHSPFPLPLLSPPPSSSSLLPPPLSSSLLLSPPPSSSLLQAQHEMELKRLKTELLEMKKQRVKMLNRMRYRSTLPSTFLFTPYMLSPSILSHRTSLK